MRAGLNSFRLERCLMRDVAECDINAAVGTHPLGIFMLNSAVLVASRMLTQLVPKLEIGWLVAHRTHQQYNYTLTNKSSLKQF
ncbi:hypothetical protein Plhal304r1_c030g0099181 [Plasmopara halstedii]